MYIQLYYLLELVSLFVGMILPLLLAIAFFTVMERQIMAAIQRRQGPNVVGFYGLFQAITDGLKLLVKESILPKSSNIIIFIFSPVFTFGLAMAGWLVIVGAENSMLSDFNLGLLYIFALSGLGVHTVIMAGWSSNSKYAFLGGLRSAAQMISYEVSLGVLIVGILLFTGSLNFSTIIESQTTVWYALPLLPKFIMFFISALAETNRHPFDLPEAEAELVSGYNVEYSAMGFALFFLAEYSNIILISSVAGILFLGGWHPILNIIPLNWIPGALYFGVKTIFFMILFIVVRALLPRYRYDQLMRLGWKIFLPFALSLAFFYGSLLLSFNAYPTFIY